MTDNNKEIEKLKKDFIAKGFFEQLNEANRTEDIKKIHRIIQNFYDSPYWQRENLPQEVEDYARNSYGWFQARDVLRDLRVRDKSDVRNVRQKLRRMAEAGELERHESRDATYRLLDPKLEEIKWWEATGKDIDLKFPFGIEKHVKIFGKNLILIAGVQNAGKSAFVLDFIRLNMYNHNIHIFNSEVGKEELNERIQLMDDINKDDLKERVKFYERSGDFDVVIQPNDINIIDYLEVTGGEGREFAMVGQQILEIFEALEDGIALIMLQKNYNQILGLGGSRGLEKPRLYITIDHNKLKIIKAKNWRGTENPNGHWAKFKLVGGNEFIVTRPLGPTVIDPETDKELKI